MRTSRRTVRFPSLRVFIAALLALSCASTAVAAPSNSAIRAKQAQAADAQRKMDALSATLELRAEELAEVEDRLQKTRTAALAAEQDLERATAALEDAQSKLQRRATNIYRHGRLDPVAVFLGATTFQDFITRYDLLGRIGRSDASMVVSVRDARSQVDRTKRALEARQDELTVLRARSREKQEAVAVALGEQRRYLGSLKKEISKLIAAERARQERLARERAAQQGLTFDPSKLSGPHAEVVRIAARYLGVRYVWGGTTPAGFDCSGLMMYCYRQIGIDLPRTSRQQFHAGTYIPPDRKDLLEPGDLVFFGYGGDPKRIHHVGMYAGGGSFIHAPQTGDVVRVTSLSSRSDYVGACRP